MAKETEPQELVFVDTSGWYALVDENDPDHNPVKEWFEDNRSPLVTSEYIFDETITLIRTSLGHREAVAFGEKVKKSRLTQIISVSGEDRKDGWKIFKKYDDQIFSFTDCVSFAQMERLGINVVLGLDEDFRTMGYRVVPG